MNNEGTKKSEKQLLKEAFIFGAVKEAIEEGLTIDESTEKFATLIALFMYSDEGSMADKIKKTEIEIREEFTHQEREKKEMVVLEKKCNRIQNKIVMAIQKISGEEGLETCPEHYDVQLKVTVEPLSRYKDNPHLKHTVGSTTGVHSDSRTGEKPQTLTIKKPTHTLETLEKGDIKDLSMTNLLTIMAEGSIQGGRSESECWEMSKEALFREYDKKTIEQREGIERHNLEAMLHLAYKVCKMAHTYSSNKDNN